MTFQQYIDNPLGKQNAVFSQRELYKTQYTQKFDVVFLREAGEIKFYLYYDKGKDVYYCHVLVPSETVENFYYDVVVRFSTTNNAIRVSNNLHEYDVQFFSNDPAFVFTYARVFLKNNMYAEELKSKGSKFAHKNDPDQRNPYQIPGYVKSLYFAYLFMRRKNLFNKTMYTTAGERYSKAVMLQRVRPFEIVMEERKEKEAEEKRRKKQEKKTPGQVPKQNKPSNTTQTMRRVNKLVKNAVRPGTTAKMVKPKGTTKKTRGFKKS